MKRISYWAKTHKWPSRIIIVAAFIVLNILGMVTGILLSQLNISIPVWLMINFFAAFLIAMIIYPSKDKKGKKISAAAFYIKQKCCDFILAASTFCMIVYLGNHPNRMFQFYPTLNAAVKSESSLPPDSLNRSYKSIKDFTASMKDENGNNLKWKEKRKLLKEQIKGIKKANDLTDGQKILFTILAVLAALGLLFLITTLACNLSCSGSDAAAVLVGVGGTALVVYLLVIVIRSIYGKRKRQRKASEKSTQSS